MPMGDNEGLTPLTIIQSYKAWASLIFYYEIAIHSVLSQLNGSLLLVCNTHFIIYTFLGLSP